MAVTLESMRADIARIIELDPSEVGDADNLPDLGLDSMRLMDLISLWEDQGLRADFSIFAEHASLGEWWQAVQHLQAGA